MRAKVVAVAGRRPLFGRAGCQVGAGSWPPQPRVSDPSSAAHLRADDPAAGQSAGGWLPAVVNHRRQPARPVNGADAFGARDRRAVGGGQILFIQMAASKCLLALILALGAASWRVGRRQWAQRGNKWICLNGKRSEGKRGQEKGRWALQLVGR